MCESCNYYDEQLQAAHAKIALLEAKVETLTEQLRNTKHQPLDETFAANSDSPLSKQCITSQSSIQPSTAASTIRDVSKLVQNGFKCKLNSIFMHIYLDKMEFIINCIQSTCIQQASNVELVAWHSALQKSWVFTCKTVISQRNFQYFSAQCVKKCTQQLMNFALTCKHIPKI